MFRNYLISALRNLMRNLVAAHLKLRFNEIEAVTRILDQDVRLRRGPIESKENIFWADHNVFEVLTLPVFAGKLEGALERPDGTREDNDPSFSPGVPESR
jgi:hypothetical protein